ncbi:hypothetical protein FSARC_8695 [Fusarium sarcochroum]|uniref:Uncharacterized protein n=1 Tax=Fusarium sarcochroum TaxID=1208366 RepID=A0A8H4TSQ9_9HYPO|nr:hypothetical protein FSARC_8695 [Fusarium sarcochroum]
MGSLLKRPSQCTIGEEMAIGNLAHAWAVHVNMMPEFSALTCTMRDEYLKEVLCYWNGTLKSVINFPTPKKRVISEMSVQGGVLKRDHPDSPKKEAAKRKADYIEERSEKELKARKTGAPCHLSATISHPMSMLKFDKRDDCGKTVGDEHVDVGNNQERFDTEVACVMNFDAYEKNRARAYNREYLIALGRQQFQKWRTPMVLGRASNEPTPATQELSGIQKPKLTPQQLNDIITRCQSYLSDSEGRQPRE